MGRLKDYTKSLIVNNIPSFIRNEIIIRQENIISFENSSYAQEGEDRVLERLFEGKSKGLYVDIGAHHPIRFSNTYLFYKKGWRGLNIDAMPGTKINFNKYRSGDINLELGISKTNEILDYYNFRETALNTFSKELADSYIKGNWELNNIIKIKTYPLKEIFNKYLEQNIKIDFLTMDIEGLELEALQSNDWINFKPQILLIEMLDFDLSNYTGNPIINYLTSVGYKIIAKTMNTVFFENI